MNLSHHPCFNASARHQYGRIHLPIAPRCNMQCNFCNRKFDCANESRPGVTSKVLEPVQAAWYLDQVLAHVPNITVVGIAGPGDPFANPRETLETCRLVSEKHPEMMLCLATNGLNLPPYIDELTKYNVSHVTLTINGVDPQVTSDIYAWMRIGRRVRRGLEAAELLLANQLESIVELKKHGVIVKVNTIVIPGVNDHHVLDVANKIHDLGADLHNLMPLRPVEGTPFGELDEPEPGLITRLRAQCGEVLPQMRHCSRCRADAVGLLGKSNAVDVVELLDRASKYQPANAPQCIAVGTYEGAMVNVGLGYAEALSVYQPTTDGFELLEVRQTPERGDGTMRWVKLAERFSDCRAIVVSEAGPSPKQTLEKIGMRVVETDGLLENALADLWQGKIPQQPMMSLPQIPVSKSSVSLEGEACTPAMCSQCPGC